MLLIWEFCVSLRAPWDEDVLEIHVPGSVWVLWVVSMMESFEFRSGQPAAQEHGVVSSLSVILCVSCSLFPSQVPNLPGSLHLLF